MDEKIINGWNKKLENCNYPMFLTLDYIKDSIPLLNGMPKDLKDRIYLIELQPDGSIRICFDSYFKYFK